jgi:tRNA(Arg) A34 adenosine deaminase TadA
MNRHQRRLNDLFNLARDHHPTDLASIVASIYISNRLVSYGFNSRKTHPLQYKYSKNSKAICIHAEIDAIRNALRVVDHNALSSSSATMYIARAKSPAQRKPKSLMGLAKPCSGCARAIAAFGIRNVYYTED